MHLLLVLNGVISIIMWEKYGKQVLTVPADGMCFLTSVQMCMKHDLAIEYSIAEIKEKLLNEVIDDLEFYQSYHTGNKLKLVQDIFSYTNRNQFTLDVVDVVVNACANSLGINMYIFSRNGSEALLLPTFSRKQVPKNKSIFLKYDRFGGNIHSGDHYSPIVDCKLDQPNCANTCIVTNSPSVDLSHSHTNIANSPNKQLPLPTEPEQESTGINSNQLDSSLDVTLTVPSTQIIDEIMEAWRRKMTMTCFMTFMGVELMLHKQRIQLMWNRIRKPHTLVRKKGLI